MLDISAIIGGLGSIAKVVYDLLNETDKEKYDKLCKQAVKDCEEFRDALLDDDWDNVQSLFDGLQHGIQVGLTSTERRQLNDTIVGKRLDCLDILGLYCRARSAQLCNEVIVLSNRANFKDSWPD